jgi:hypothetical protein
MICEPAEFGTYHAPALELQEVKHRLIVNALGQMGCQKSVKISHWICPHIPGRVFDYE